MVTALWPSTDNSKTIDKKILKQAAKIVKLILQQPDLELQFLELNYVLIINKYL